MLIGLPQPPRLTSSLVGGVSLSAGPLESFGGCTRMRYLGQYGRKEVEDFMMIVLEICLLYGITFVSCSLLD